MGYVIDRLRAAGENITLAIAFLNDAENGHKRTNIDIINNGEYDLKDGEDADRLIDTILEERLFSQGQADGSAKTGAAPIETIKEEGPPMPKLLRGSITKRKDGRWMGRYYDADGIQKACYANSKLECIDKTNHSIRQSDKEAADSAVSKKMTLMVWSQTWLETYKKPKVRPSSITNITQLFTNYIIPKLGKKEVGKISAIDVERLMNGIKAPSQKSKAYVYLKECLEDLRRNKGVKENACSFVKAPSAPKSKAHAAIGETAMAAFLERLKGTSVPHWRFAQFLAYTGLRKGEALALTWADIDREKKTVSVSKSFDDWRKTTNDPKTDNGFRLVPLFEPSSEALAGKAIDAPQVFGDMRERKMQVRFASSCRKCGMPLTAHAFRHYFISLCHEKGIDPLVIKGWVGHSSIEMTNGTYTHLGLEFINEQARKLAKKKE